MTHGRSQTPRAHRAPALTRVRSGRRAPDSTHVLSGHRAPDSTHVLSGHRAPDSTCVQLGHHAADPDEARSCHRAPVPARVRSSSRKKVTPTGIVFVDDFEVRFTRKNVKNLRIRVVAPDGHIEASVPMTMSLDEVCAFVRRKADWARKQQQRLARSPQVMAEQASKAEQEQWRALVSALVPVLVEAWEPIIGVKAGKLAYRNMKSRWGSCQPAPGRICINTRLALYPPECLEYVVVHELCHLREGGHGPQFHALMDAYLPDWRTRRAKLS